MTARPPSHVLESGGRLRNRATVLYELDISSMTIERGSDPIYQAVVDLSHIPFHQLLMPEKYFSKSFCDHLNQYLISNELRDSNDLHIRLCVAGLREKDKKAAPGVNVNAAQSYLSDIRKLLGPLARLGRDFRREYSEMFGPLPDRRVAEECIVESHPYKARKRYLQANTKSIHAPASYELAQQQVLKLPRRKHTGKRSGLKSDKILRQVLLKRLRKVGIKEAIPELLGFVPSKVADKQVRKTAFTDSHWALNLLHGNESHLIQLAMLADLGVMDQETLTWIIDHSLWVPLLDRISAASCESYLIKNPSADDLTQLDNLGGDTTVRPTQVTLRSGSFMLSANNPESIHRRFLAGEFSDAIARLNKELDTEGVMKLLNMLGVPVSDNDAENREALGEVEKDLAGLEWAITNKQLTTMQHIAEQMGLEDETELFRKETATTGDFFLSEEFRQLIREKARRHLKKGRKVYGVDSKTNSIVQIQIAAETERFSSFVVYRD
ncbi:MAG: hypothetical protein ACR2PX_01935 [Endozoicomonas sp.]|uniref:hypothetical protein n=1 Tax=Endozoicomonas sp. TaxID=1892382 RepID=UPI003D9AB77C